MNDFSWIVNESNLPWLELDIEFPYAEMLRRSSKTIKHLFVSSSRPRSSTGGL